MGNLALSIRHGLCSINSDKRASFGSLPSSAPFVGGFASINLLSNEVALNVEIGETCSWEMFFDGVSQLNGKGDRVSSAEILFISPDGQVMPYPFTFSSPCSNNLAECQALLMGLELAKALNLTHLKVLWGL